MVFDRPTLASLTIEEKIGQMIVAGFPEKDIHGSGLEASMRSLPIGNFILFARNVGSPEELFGLNAALRRLAAERRGIPPLIAVDQEGGVVTRIQSGATFFPGAMASSAALYLASSIRVTDSSMRDSGMAPERSAATREAWALSWTARVWLMQRRSAPACTARRAASG
jgi:beta-glucosidase-like glycosyl hydrolase